MKLTDEMLDAITDVARRWDWESMSRASARERIREDLAHVFADVPEPSRLDNVEDFAGELVCKYHGLDRCYGPYQDLKAKMTEALLFVARMRDGKKAAP